MSLIDYWKKLTGRGREVKHDQRRRRKKQRDLRSQKETIKRDIAFRKDMINIKDNFTYKMRPSEKKIDKAILKNQKKNLWKVRMGGTATDIFDISMPRPEINMRPKNIFKSLKNPLWKLSK